LEKERTVKKKKYKRKKELHDQGLKGSRKEWIVPALAA